MPTTHINDHALLSVSGPDAEHFLQNIITPDLNALRQGDAMPGALLTPQGKILFDFLISRSGVDGFILECRSDIADDFMRRLTLYKLRSKLEISKSEQTVIGVSWHIESGASQIDSTASQIDSTGLRDRRFAEALNVLRFYANAPASDASNDDFAALRIAHGIAESGDDYTLSDAFPHDVLFDQNGGVGLKKGCYVGQEVVSRMHHRNTARRRVLIAEGGVDLPPPGTTITADGRAVGTLGSVAGNRGLAIARIDKVKAAADKNVPLMAGDVALTLAIPAWAKFTFPETGTDAEAD